MRYTALRVETVDAHVLAAMLYQQLKLAVSCRWVHHDADKCADVSVFEGYSRNVAST